MTQHNGGLLSRGRLRNSGVKAKISGHNELWKSSNAKLNQDEGLTYMKPENQ